MLFYMHVQTLRIIRILNTDNGDSHDYSSVKNYDNLLWPRTVEIGLIF